MTETPKQPLPEILTGPLLRRVSPTSVAFWIVTRKHRSVRLTLLPERSPARYWSAEQTESSIRRIDLADSAHLILMEIHCSDPLPTGCWIGYHLEFNISDQWIPATELLPELCYEDQATPGFVIQPTVQHLLHGSCRKPHHPSGDGLVRADLELSKTPVDQWPALMVMSGDQVYVDDVATPMLMLSHKVIDRLGFAAEQLPDCPVSDSHELHLLRPYYMIRDQLLPDTSVARESIFEGARKPIFTSVHSRNHLVSLAEVITLYLLMWSPTLWHSFSTEWAQLSPLDDWTEKQRTDFESEKQVISEFAETLPRVQRLMAHLPSAMIFDDHDVTDDWNLTPQWEYDAYEHPFSKRIIGNALFGYALCQGWGNAPERFPEHWYDLAQQCLSGDGGESHDHFIHDLLNFRHWNYRWATQPPLIVLDTRTHRWRAERLHKPSGLMDFESLMQLHRELQHESSVLLVSAAPMFGVKLIEAIQKLFTLANHPLMVDAENWMAHRGSASTLMNIFHHQKTPGQFVILSGDVHYSFVYDIELRRGDLGQDLWQITSSGIKNEFPAGLLTWFDRLNRWLYAPASPLNWFTRRRSLKVIPRKPVGGRRGSRLINHAGIGSVYLDKKGVPVKVEQLCSDGQTIRFRL